MYKVKKDGLIIKVKNEIQLSAFLNSGWEEVKDTKKTKKS